MVGVVGVGVGLLGDVQGLWHGMGRHRVRRICLGRVRVRGGVRRLCGAGARGTGEVDWEVIGG